MDPLSGKIVGHSYLNHIDKLLQVVTFVNLLINNDECGEADNVGVLIDDVDDASAADTVLVTACSDNDEPTFGNECGFVVELSGDVDVLAANDGWITSEQLTKFALE